MAQIVVSGYVVRYPLAGNVWAHFQYVLGLHRLGHDVVFVEEAGWEDSCYDPEHDSMSSSCASGVRILDDLARAFGLEGRWAYRDWEGGWHGLDGQTVHDAIANADLFLDVGGSCDFEEMGLAGHRAYVDMDPGFTQFDAFGAGERIASYDTLFSYGANIGQDGCTIPTAGLEWHPLRPPVVLDLWCSGPSLPAAGTAWTTVASWSSLGARVWNGETYGQKDVEFARFIDLPTKTPYPLEVAIDVPDASGDRLRGERWRLIDPLDVSSDPWVYREYIWRSRGEFSVAKNAYVKTRSGWFSDRTAAYLGSGRPAVVQDTGLNGDIPTGRGLLLFRTDAEAAEALKAVESDYAEHAAAARELAVDHLDSDKVLTRLLETCGVDR
jgi:hypothetical protein